ncbi:MAG: NUDIX hydrolase [Acidimicrobiales bacterium]
MAEVVHAAGGVVWRRGPSGVEILRVHRPKYDDWSLPKGKLDPGETSEAAALREVEEETGLRCLLGKELPPVTYTDRHGRAKVVRYWAMEVLSGRFRPNDEVDEVRWVTPGGAGALLTYGRDRQVTASLAV